MDSLLIGSTSVIGGAIVEKLASLGSVVTAGRREAHPIDLCVTEPLPVIPDQRVDAVIFVAADFGGPTDQDLIRATQVRASPRVDHGRSHRCAGESQALRADVFDLGLLSAGRRVLQRLASWTAQSEQVVSFYCAEHGIDWSDGAAERRLRLQRQVSCTPAAADGSSIVHGQGRTSRLQVRPIPCATTSMCADVASLVAGLVSRTEVGTFVCAQRASLPISVIAETWRTLCSATVDVCSSMRRSLTSPNSRRLPSPPEVRSGHRRFPSRKAFAESVISRSARGMRTVMVTARGAIIGYGVLRSLR